MGIRIKNNRASLVVAMLAGDRSIRLNPGINEVSEKDWAEAEETNLTIKNMVGDGTLEPDPDAKQTAKEKRIEDNRTTDTGASRPLKELSEKQAIEVVKATTDRALLAGYRETDSRAAVQKAISDQEAAITLSADERATAGGKGDRGPKAVK